SARESFFLKNNLPLCRPNLALSVGGQICPGEKSTVNANATKARRKEEMKKLQTNDAGIPAAQQFKSQGKILMKNSNKNLFLMAALTLDLLLAPQTKAGSFSTTGSLNGARAGHAAILLGNGTVLLTGGFDGTGPGRL